MKKPPSAIGIATIQTTGSRNHVYKNVATKVSGDVYFAIQADAKAKGQSVAEWLRELIDKELRRPRK